MTLRDFLTKYSNIDESFTLPGARITTTAREIMDHADEREGYIIKGRTVWAICYTPGRGFFSQKRATKSRKGTPLTRPGFYYWANSDLAKKMAKACHE